MSNLPPNRFFPRGIKPGEPLSKRGVTDALMKIAHALDNMTVHNGHVDWSGDVPKIIIDKMEQRP